MSVLDDFDEEMNFNVSNGEFSQSFTIMYGTVQIPLSGIASNAWKREEKDGRLDPASPMLIPSVVVPLVTLRGYGITVDKYKSLKVSVGGYEYGVVSYEDTNPVRLFLKSDSTSEPEPEPEGGGDVEPTPEPEPEPEP